MKKMMSAPGRRLLGALLGLALFTAGGRGLCFMQAAPSAPAKTADAHKCCKKGLSGKAPSCCHLQAGTNVPARVEKTTVLAVSNAVVVLLRQTVVGPSSEPAPARSPSSHSPPPTVLRI